MSHYKHVFNAINNTLHHLKQAQECCDDLKDLDDAYAEDLDDQEFKQDEQAQQQ